MFQRGPAAAESVFLRCMRNAGESGVAFGNTRRGGRQAVLQARARSKVRLPLGVRPGDGRGAAELEAQAGSTCRDCWELMERRTREWAAA